MAYYGLKGTTEHASTTNYDPRSGRSLIRHFSGTPDEIRTIEALFNGIGVRTSVTHSEDGGYSKLDAYVSAGEADPSVDILADRWEMPGNDLEKSLWEQPRIQAEFAKLRISETFPETEKLQLVAFIKTSVEALSKGERKVTGVDGQETDITIDTLANLIKASGMSDGPFRGLIYDMGRGVEGFSLPQYVLRRVTIVPSGTNLRPALGNVGKIFTSTARLKASERIPQTLLFILPDGVWLKRTPTVQQTASDRWEVQQEWWHADDYSRNIYQTAT